jgi:hypothetical protein
MFKTGNKILRSAFLPGRACTREITGKSMMKLRVFPVSKRLYQAMAVGTKEQIDDEDTMKDLTSFRLLAHAAVR